MTDRPPTGTPHDPPADPPADPSADPRAEDYRRVGFNRRLGFGGSPALLVVDVCRAYFEPGSPLDIGRPEVLDAVGSLVAGARAAGLPVLWTRVEFEPGGADGGVFYRKVGALALFDRGQPLGGWVSDLTPGPGEAVITKQGASAFFGTDLAGRLRAAGVDTVIVCGVSTSGCVRASALDACQHDLVPIVVEEACGDRDPTVHHANLFDLDAKYADVEPLAAVLAHLAHLDGPPAC